MLYGMLISAVITFTMLGAAKRLPAPYWNILLHAHEATLAIFLFCAIGMFLRTLERLGQHPKMRFRGRTIEPQKVRTLPWKQMLALMMAVTAVTYRFAVIHAYTAFHDVGTASFDPWTQRGNVFSLTLAALAGTIAAAHLKQERLRYRLIAWVSFAASVVSLTPLLMGVGLAPYHPASILLAAGGGVLFYLAARWIKRRWDVL